MMAIIFKNNCPCIGCIYLTVSETSHEYWCKRKHHTVTMHNGNGFHSAGQWIIPCGREMWLYKEGTIQNDDMEGEENADD